MREDLRVYGAVWKETIMIKISAKVSKVVPIPGADFSSLQYGATMEVEVSDGEKPDAIRERIRALYDLLSVAVDEQITGAGHHQVGVASGDKRDAPAPVPHAAIGYSRTIRGNFGDAHETSC